MSLEPRVAVDLRPLELRGAAAARKRTMKQTSSALDEQEDRAREDRGSSQ